MTEPSDLTDRIRAAFRGQASNARPRGVFKFRSWEDLQAFKERLKEARDSEQASHDTLLTAMSRNRES